MSKRARSGTGSIYKRSSDGRWVGSIRWLDGADPVNGDGGVPKRRTVYGDTRREVEGKLRDVRALIDAGAAVVETPDRVDVVVERWIVNVLEASAKRTTTIDRDRTILRTKVVAYLGSKRLPELSERVIAGWYRQLVDDGVAASTITKASGLLANVLDNSVERRLIRSHVVRKVGRPSVERSEAVYFTSEEVGRLLDAAQRMEDDIRATRPEYRSRELPLLMLAVFTGCRVGELLGLRWRDVRLDRGEIAITGTLVRTGGRLRRHEPKTKAGIRVVPLPPEAVAAIKSTAAIQTIDREASEHWFDSGYVFTTVTGEPVDPSNARRWLARVKDRAGIEQGSWHSFRHSYASQLLAAGTSIVTVSRILGHSRIGVTIDTYGHLETSKVADEVRAGLAGYGSTTPEPDNVVPLRAV